MIYFTVEPLFEHLPVFPVDMLRYDNCWPHDAISASVIMQAIRREPLVEWQSPKIHLCSPYKPSVRWESFGWRVTKKAGRPY